MRFARVASVGLAGLVLAGCGAVDGLLGGDDNTAPPTELQDIEAAVEITSVWRNDVGAGPGDYFLKLTTAVAGGRVFAASRKGDVVAYDAISGEELWETDTDALLSGGPGAGSGVVVVGSRNGEVFALSPVNGEIVWETRVSSEVLSTPRADQGVVVVRTSDGRLFGLDATDGTRIWVYDRGVPALTLRGNSSPAIADGIAVSGFDGGRVVAVSLPTGQPLWESRIALPTGRSELDRMVDIDGDVLVRDDVVFVVTYQGRIAAVDLITGSIHWRVDMSSHAGIGVDDTTIYVTDEESHVIALRSDGEGERWRQTELAARQLTSPTVFKDYVVVADFDGYVHWLSREDGKFVGRIRVDSDGIVVAPVSTDDFLYVYGRGGKVAALQIQ